MSSPKRILVVSRKFWPLVDEGCHRLLGWSHALQRRGHSIQVLTARWHASWPSQSNLRGIPIDRLLPVPSSNWNEGHFQKNVVQWISNHLDLFDVIYVDRCDGLLTAIQSKAARWSKPVVTRFTVEVQKSGLAKNQWFAPISAADACRRSTRVVTSTVFAQRLLVSHGIDARRIVRIGDVAWSSFSRKQENRQAASSALFEVSSDFVVPGRTDLILHFGEADAKTLLQTVLCVCDFLDAGASLRMWIVGSETSVDAIYPTIKSRGWHREIMLFDGFDDVEDLIAMADLAVVSNPDAALQFSVPTFANSELPLMMADTVEARNWLPDSHRSALFSSSEQLHSVMLDWMSHRRQWESDAVALKAWVRRSMPTELALDQWTNLFRDIDKQLSE